MLNEFLCKNFIGRSKNIKATEQLVMKITSFELV